MKRECRCLGLGLDLAGEVGDLEWLGEWEESPVGWRSFSSDFIHPSSRCLGADSALERLALPLVHSGMVDL